MLRTIGIDAQTFVAGDSITIRAAPHRDPAFRFAKALRVADEFGAEYVMADSERLFSPTLRAAAAALTGDSAEEDERPGTTPAVTGATALAGRWQQPLLEFATDGPNLPLNEAGMKAWREYVRKDSPANTCEPLSVPAVFLAPFFLFELRIDAQQAVLSNEAYEIVRTVPLDGTTAAVDERGSVRPRARPPRARHARRRKQRVSCFEVGARARGGARRRRRAVVAAKTLVERFSALPDGRTLVYEYTLHDPVYMTEPYTGRVELTRVPDGVEMYEYECDLESARMWSRDPTDAPLRVDDAR